MEIIGWIVWGLACAWAVFGFRAFITNPRCLSLPWYDAPILKNNRWWCLSCWYDSCHSCNVRLGHLETTSPVVYTSIHYLKQGGASLDLYGCHKDRIWRFKH